MIDQQYLLNDEGVQNFIKNGYVTVQPDLPDVHEEIHRETAAIFEKEGDPRNHILQKVPALYQVFAHPAVRGVLTRFSFHRPNRGNETQKSHIQPTERKYVDTAS